MQNFTSKLSEKWAKSNRDIKNFELNNKEWLGTNVILPDLQRQTSSDSESGPSGIQFGRPLKGFSEVTGRSKRAKVTDLLENKSHEELLFATRASFYKRGKRDAAKMLQEFESSPKRASHIKKAFYSPSKDPVPYSPLPFTFTEVNL